MMQLPENMDGTRYVARIPFNFRRPQDVIVTAESDGIMIGDRKFPVGTKIRLLDVLKMYVDDPSATRPADEELPETTAKCS